jgi:pyrimidine-nucleoside phosphorylase
MNPVEIIRKKRNGGVLAPEELQAFIAGYLAGDVAEYQMSAFLMAVFFRGMTEEETSGLTRVMLHSGEVIDLSAIPGVKVDKHSTGGVGDKVSLILAPIVAACGVPVPMISGRGLGHTGGTLDKLESIPGFRTRLSTAEYREAIRRTGVALIGQTETIAPADRRMYALRDVTGTVESIPLIAGSIMSKKLAEGIDALVLDVKSGNGAFMRSDADALELARTLVGIGAAMGKRTVGFLTSMDQPLGHAVGNWCEVVESVECLRGRTIPDLMEVTYVLGGAMLWLGGKAADIEEGMALCRSAVWSGRAYEKFLEVVRHQGGDTGVLEHTDRYPAPRFTAELVSTCAGFVTGFDTLAIGMTATALGAGRRRIEDVIDPTAGIHVRCKIGTRVERGDILAVVMAGRGEDLPPALERIAGSITIGQRPGEPGSPVRMMVDETGVHPWNTPVQY